VRRARPVVLAWAFVAVLTGAPYLQARLHPPPGQIFAGFFYYLDDQYNYLSFVEQAERGSFAFVNKLVTADHPPALVNVEWWTVGRLSALLGHRPLIAYRLFGLLAALLLLAGADHWLRRLGLPESHRLPALLLVATGAGFGGILFALGWPLMRCLDLATGIFPLIGLLANAHFVTGTALLLWALAAYDEAARPSDHLKAALLGTAVGLVRPYDLVMLAAVRGASVLFTKPATQWWRLLLPLAGLLPAVLYNGWLFYANPAFAFYTRIPYEFPPPLDFLPAFGPVLLLAAPASAAPLEDKGAREARTSLLLWIAVGFLVVVANPLHFSMQFLVGIGFPLLALVAFGLRRFPPAATLLVAIAFASTAFFAVRFTLSGNPYWFPPRENMAAAVAMRASCRPGDIALGPSEIGQLVGGLSACKAYVSHPIGPDFERREDEMRLFYAADTAAAVRRRFLDEHCLTHLVLPGDAGVSPTAWLGGGADLRRFALVGEPARLSLYARPRPAGCTPP
jgi:hypothetical protein